MNFRTSENGFPKLVIIELQLLNVYYMFLINFIKWFVCNEETSTSKHAKLTALTDRFIKTDLKPCFKLVLSADAFHIVNTH